MELNYNELELIIEQGGGFFKGMTINNFGTKSLSRNNLLFGLMQRMGLVEKVGSGIIRMKNMMNESELPDLEFKISKNWFSIFFQRIEKEKSSPKSSLKNWSEISEKQKEILLFIEDNKFITRKELSKKIKINQSVIQKHLDKLKDKRILQRVGADRGGHWEILKKKNSG